MGLIPKPRTSAALQASSVHDGAVAEPSALRGHDLDVQLRMLRPVQLHGGGGAAGVQEAAAAGVRGSGGALPHAQQIQGAFGRHDVSSVQAHVGGAAAAACGDIGAEAYATGSSVAFASGPDLHTAAHEAAHVVQQRGGVQLSGGVGQAGDRYEQHADAVADRVVSGQSAEGLLDKYASSGPTVGHSAQLKVQRKGNRTVRQGSSGSTVKKLQQRLNANGWEPPLEVDGAFGALTKAAVVAFQKSHTDAEGLALDPDGVVGPKTWGAISGVHATPDIAPTQDEAGDHLVERMNENNKDPHTATQGVHYDFNFKNNHPDKWKDDYSNGYADPQYFERIGWMDWRLKANVSASAGIKSWLRGLTIAECNSAIVAMQIDTVRATLGDKRFDELYGSTDKPVARDARMRVKVGTQDTPVEGLLKDTPGSAKGDAGTAGKRPVNKGDWCYFYNHPQYLLKHPGGAFQGENALYMGMKSGKQMWAGMGVDNVSEGHMLQAMVGAYNNDRNEWDQKALDRIKANNGGTLPAEYDPASGIFPDKLSGPGDVLSAAAYTIDGVTRKGGFVGDGAYRLDIEAVKARK